ncbi:MAG: 6-phosphofructokinase [Lachnospiraceae bacterium]|nr:6-phosphofructokinase [Lachnospiraceae bacterium]
MKTLLVGQSGGPTSAINATLSGVIEQAAKAGLRVLGARNGIEGVFKENFIDLTQKAKDEEFVSLLSKTPASALGSCRYKLNSKNIEEFEKIVEVFHRNDIAYFVYIGGNDSMDTVYQLDKYLREHHIEDIKVIGAPKTIDNDLCGIDHCPGFGSSAKYIATIFAELERELIVYDLESVLIIELMGRNAGWLAASAVLAQNQSGQVPYLIYLEESDFSLEKFELDLRQALAKNKQVIVSISEGLHDESGEYLFNLGKNEGRLDAFGHAQAGGAGKILEEYVRSQIGCKVRSIEVNLLQRCAAHILSATDIEESKKLGEHATELVLEGMSGKMSSLQRVPGKEYKVEYTVTDIREVANREKKVPREWMNAAHNGVTQEMVDYLLPLVQGEIFCEYENGLPKYIVL